MNFNSIVDRDCFNTSKFTQRREKFGRNDIQPMWIADMDFACPEFLLEALQERARHPVFGSVAPPKSAIAAQIDWLAQHQNFHIQPDWVFSSHSVIAAIHMAIQAFTNKGDEIVIMPPVYQGFAQAVLNEDRTLLHWRLKPNDGQYHFDLSDLERIISKRTKMLLLCSPHNPVGRVWTEDELLGISDFCQQNNIIVVADEIHADLTYQTNVFKPYAAVSRASADHSITIQGPAKSFNLTGLPLASAIISNAHLREAFAKTHRNSHPGYGDAFSQVAFETVYRHGYSWLEELKSYLNENQALLETRLKPGKVIFNKCEATYLAWLDCRELRLNDDELMNFFVNDLALGLSPGVQFGPGGEGHMRLNFATPASQLSDALNRLCNHPLVTG